MELRSIAYVEDEDDIRSLTEISLSMIGGLEVRTYATGDEALADIPAFGPDMIMTDVMMPIMDGKELVRRLSSDPALAHIPTVFITAKTLARDREELMGLGASAIITKPYDPMTLSDDLRKIWGRLQDGKVEMT